MVETILSSLLTGLICLVAGLRLRIGSDVFERRRAFRVRLDVLMAKLRDTSDGQVLMFHRDTFTTIRDECAQIRSDVFWLRRRCLDEAARQYYILAQTEPREDVQQSGKIKLTRAKTDFPGRKRVHDLLMKMRDYAK